MKIINLTVAILLAAVTTHAQNAEFGIRGGLNFSSIRGDVSNTAPLTAFHLGACLSFPVYDFFSIQPEVVFSYQGMKVEKNESETLTIMNYINIPIMFQFEVAENFKLKTGPQLGAFLGGKTRTITPLQKTEINLSSEDTQDFDVGVGIGASYVNSLGILFEGRYNLGLTDIKKGEMKQMNNVVQLSLGFVF